MNVSIAGNAVMLVDGAAVIRIPRDELLAVSVHAVDTIVGGIVKYIVLEQSHGDCVEVSDGTEGFAAFVEALPALLGFDGALLRDAIACATPDASPLVVPSR